MLRIATQARENLADAEAVNDAIRAGCESQSKSSREDIDSLGSNFQAQGEPFPLKEPLAQRVLMGYVLTDYSANAHGVTAKRFSICPSRAK
jgi:hypothetical protein